MRKNVAKMPQFFLVDNPSDWTYNNNMKERTMTIDTKTEAGAYYHAIAKRSARINSKALTLSIHHKHWLKKS